MKKCSKCKINKDRKSFRQDCEQKDGLRSHCKSCDYENRKKYYQKNKSSIAISEKKRLFKQKMKIFEHYGGGVAHCKCCNEKEVYFLSIDHINGGGNKQKKELKTSSRGIMRWIIKNNYPVDFQVLCFNCNLSKGFFGKCPHSNTQKSELGASDTLELRVQKLEKFVEHISKAFNGLEK